MRVSMAPPQERFLILVTGFHYREIVVKSSLQRAFTKCEVFAVVVTGDVKTFTFIWIVYVHLDLRHLSVQSSEEYNLLDSHSPSSPTSLQGFSNPMFFFLIAWCVENLQIPAGISSNLSQMHQTLI